MVEVSVSAKKENLASASVEAYGSKHKNSFAIRCGA